MIDQVRRAGITPWFKIACMAEAFNLPVVTHGIPEIHVHLVGAAQRSDGRVHAPPLPSLRGSSDPENGGLAIPAATRLGLKFNQETIRRFGVA